MNFKDLLTVAKAHYTIDSLSLNMTEPIEDVVLISPDLKGWDRHTLYIGQPESIKQELDGSIQLVLTSAPESEDFVFDFTKSNLAFIDPDELISFFNFANQHFYRTLKFSKQFNQLSSMVMRGDSPLDILNNASEILHNPLVVVDRGYKILCNSQTVPITNKAWIKLVEYGYLTFDFIQAKDSLTGVDDHPKSSSAYDIHCPLSPSLTMGSRIYWHGDLIGYTFLFNDTNPTTLADKDFMPFISDVLGEALSREPSFEKLHSPFPERILYHILLGEAPSYIEYLLEHCDMTYPETMVCITLELFDFHQLSFLSTQLRAALYDIFPDSYTLLHGNNLICLAPSTFYGDFGESETSALEALFDYGVISITLSHPFHQILDTKSYFQQCQKLQEIASTMHLCHQLLFYQDYVFYALLLDCKDKRQLLSRIHPSLDILLVYDSQTKNEGSLYETLETYILHNAHLKESADALGIHRNSMTYRLNKINELTHINLDDATTIFNLNISFHIAKFLRLNP